jgi:hypothetical protein
VVVGVWVVEIALPPVVVVGVAVMVVVVVVVGVVVFVVFHSAIFSSFFLLTGEKKDTRSIIELSHLCHQIFFRDVHHNIVG